MSKKNIVIDLGNYNIKYKGDNMGAFSSKYHSNFEPNPESFERIEFNGVKTYIGVGELEREYNKANKNTMAQILYAINQATKCNDINLCLLLPIEQVGNKEKLIDKLQNKSFTYKINGKTKTVNINRVIVLPEGQVSHKSIEAPSPYSLIIDIGSRTINWISYIEGKAEKNGTEKLGVYDLYSTIKTIENSKGEDFTEEDIEIQIKRGRIQVTEEVYKSFLKDVLNRIKANVNIKNYEVTFTGGGALVLKDTLNKIPGITIHNNPVYSNVIGAYKVINAVLGGK